MSIQEEILNYIPFNDQEKRDKEFIINCINKFDNIFLRENEIVHFTSSGFVVNKNRDKVLMIYHNIYIIHGDGLVDMLMEMKTY